MMFGRKRKEALAQEQEQEHGQRVKDLEKERNELVERYKEYSNVCKECRHFTTLTPDGFYTFSYICELGGKVTLKGECPRFEPKPLIFTCKHAVQVETAKGGEWPLYVCDQDPERRVVTRMLSSCEKCTKYEPIEYTIREGETEVKVEVKE